MFCWPWSSLIYLIIPSSLKPLLTLPAHRYLSLPLRRPKAPWVLPSNAQFLKGQYWTPPFFILPPLHYTGPTLWINAIELVHKTKILDEEEEELDFCLYIQRWLMKEKEKHSILELGANPAQWMCIDHRFAFRLFPRGNPDVSEILIGAPLPHIQCQLPLSLWI